MADVDPDHDRRLDVRSIDNEPFQAITDALEKLDVGDTLLLINSFEPVPLYDVLDDRGFAYDATQVTSEEWRIVVERQ